MYRKWTILALLAIILVVVGGCSELAINTPQGYIRGIVTDADSGAPVPGALVAAAGKTVPTDEEGRFSLPVSPGNYCVTIEKDGYHAYIGTISADSGSTEVLLFLEPEQPGQTDPGLVAFCIVDGTSGVTLWNPSIWINGTLQSRKGQFSLPLAPGSYTIKVTARDYLTYQDTIKLDEDSSVTIRLRTFWSQTQLQELAQLVMAEAEGEPYKGKVAVAASVLNRVYDSRYPDTLHEVIFQVVDGHYQYSPVLDGRIYNTPTQDCWNAVHDALAGWDPSLGATGFYNPAKTSNQWVRQQPVTVRIGNHVFFH